MTIGKRPRANAVTGEIEQSGHSRYTSQLLPPRCNFSLLVLDAKPPAPAATDRRLAWRPGGLAAWQSASQQALFSGPSLALWSSTMSASGEGRPSGPKDECVSSGYVYPIHASALISQAGCSSSSDLVPISLQIKQSLADGRRAEGVFGVFGVFGGRWLDGRLSAATAFRGGEPARLTHIEPAHWTDGSHGERERVR